MGWMHDILGYFSDKKPIHEVKHNQLTFGAVYQFSENFVQAFSHDEVVHGKGSLFNKMKFIHSADSIANLRALFALQWVWPGKKTLFMGCEFGQLTEWNFKLRSIGIFSMIPTHQGISRKLVADLNKLYKNHPSWAETDHICG